MVCRSHRSRLGFSLVEIIVVMAVLGILATIIVSTQSGVRERALIARAEAELVLLSKLLEDYRNKLGDYPWVAGGQSGEDVLWGALSGQRGPDGSSVVGSVDGSWLAQMSGFQFADSSGDILDELPEQAAIGGRVIQIVDPWNQPYQYHYRESASPADPWQKTGFILLSLGPSGGLAFENDATESSGVPASGLLPSSYPEDNDTFDNIIAP